MKQESRDKEQGLETRIKGQGTRKTIYESRNKKQGK